MTKTATATKTRKPATVVDLIVRLATIDAAAERKFVGTSQAMVRQRTDALRQMVADGASVAELGVVALEMKNWACFGSLRAIQWLDLQLDRLAEWLSPES